MWSCQFDVSLVNYSYSDSVHVCVNLDYSWPAVLNVSKRSQMMRHFHKDRFSNIYCNVQSNQSHSKPRRWKSMRIHQGWFTALYTQHLLDSQSFEFEICIFPREATPLHYFPPPRRLVPSLGLGTTWVRQLRSGSCHHPTAATKCNQATANPVGGKACSSTKVVYCAIYSTLTRFTKFRV